MSDYVEEERLPIARMRGVVFRCTIRGGHASLAVVVTWSEEEDGGDEEEESRSSAGGDHHCHGYEGRAHENAREAKNDNDLVSDSPIDEVPPPRVEGGHNRDERRERMVLVVVRLGGPEWEREDRDGSATTTDGQERRRRSVGGNEGAQLSALRSSVRRMCKLGNELEFRGRHLPPPTAAATNSSIVDDREVGDGASTDWRKWPKFVVDYYPPIAARTFARASGESSAGVVDSLRLHRELKWDAAKCQSVRSRYFASRPPKQAKGTRTSDDGDGAIIRPPGRMTNSNSDSLEATKGNGENRSKLRHHGGGIGKRRQGEILADFLLWMLSTVCVEGGDSAIYDAVSADAKSQCQSSALPEAVGLSPSGRRSHLFVERYVPLDPSLTPSGKRSLVAARNAAVADAIKGSVRRDNRNPIDDNDEAKDDDDTSRPSESLPTGGIIDAAGGAGHVSLALALRGVHSTVVDPRANAGKLPGRDRKALRRSKNAGSLFSTHRAWFGSRTRGVDAVFREGRRRLPQQRAQGGGDDDGTFATIAHGEDDDGTFDLPICGACTPDGLVAECRAIAALHPDEATGDIVDAAVEGQIPFVVVPCCVFSRLFPDRVKPKASPGIDVGKGGTGAEIVSTYYDLIDWLLAKHQDIKVTPLPFGGANIAVWATFT